MRPVTRFRLFVDALAIVPWLAGLGYVLWWGFWPTVVLLDASDDAFRLALLWLLSFALVVDGWVSSGRVLDEVQARPRHWRGR